MLNIQEELFPLCVVWTTIPLISWLLPCIGHTGIADSRGLLSDFTGYRINYRRLSFNRPLKYVRLAPDSPQAYDEAIADTNAAFEGQAHNLCCNNCHHHVADVLNRIGYCNRRDWGQLDIWWMCLTQCTYTDYCAMLRVWLPFLGVCGLAALGVMWLR